MLVDNTPLFRARAKMLQACKAAELAKRGLENGSWESCSADNKAMAVSSNFLSYSAKAAEIRRDITDLRNIVIDRRKDYISAVGYNRRLSLSSGMSDWERNQMDADVDKAIRQCVQLIRSFQRQIAEDSLLRAADEAPHFREIGHMLDKYLKKIAKIVSELRAVRVMKTQNVKKLSRLSNLVQLQPEVNKTSGFPVKSGFLKSGTSLVDKCYAEKSHDLIASPKSGLRKRKVGLEEIDPKEAGNLVNTNVVWYDDAEARRKETSEPMDPELERQLVIENERLYAKFIHADDDIQKVEKQLNEIYELQETFAEKVLEQEKGIDLVNQAAVDTVENISAGNEQIREAIQNMASRRVILLFCLIALTFTLLFLDWYNA